MHKLSRSVFTYKRTILLRNNLKHNCLSGAIHFNQKLANNNSKIDQL